MIGPGASRQGFTLYLLAWLMLGLMLAGLIASGTGAGWSNSLLFILPPTLLYAFAAGFSAYYLCRSHPLAERTPAVLGAVLGGAAVLSGAMWCLAAVGFNSALQSAALGWAGIEPGHPLLATMFGLGILLYGLCAAAQYLLIEVDRARAAERRELESQLAVQQAQLRMLRTQIDPHFLFNSLNSISALTAIDPAGAREMTVQLAQFFRHSLGLEAHTKVPLSDELQLIEHFLAIEKIRFAARLRVEVSIGDGASDCLLPPMILQPLVENAVKHGIANLTDGGLVRIGAERRGSQLYLSVDNTVDADQPAGTRKGIGLDNVRQRLAAAYGYHASAHWSRSGALFHVQLQLPAEIKEP
jgi:two-component system sensor histidine kinase AlgZ